MKQRNKGINETRKTGHQKAMKSMQKGKYFFATLGQFKAFGKFILFFDFLANIFARLAIIFDRLANI